MKPRHRIVLFLDAPTEAGTVLANALAEYAEQLGATGVSVTNTKVQDTLPPDSAAGDEKTSGPCSHEYYQIHDDGFFFLRCHKCKKETLK